MRFEQYCRLLVASEAEESPESPKCSTSPQACRSDWFAQAKKINGPITSKLLSKAKSLFRCPECNAFVSSMEEVSLTVCSWLAFAHLPQQILLRKSLLTKASCSRDFKPKCREGLEALWHFGRWRPSRPFQKVSRGVWCGGACKLLEASPPARAVGNSS